MGNLYNSFNPGYKIVIERHIPELAENNDEKIRKHLIRMVRNVENDSMENSTKFK